MSIMITGGVGFIGSHLAKQLVKRGEEVVLFDVAPNHRLIDQIKDKVQIVRGDLAVWADVLDAVKRHAIKEVFHLGAVLSAAAELSPMTTFGVNFLGTVNILEAARLFDVAKVVYSSSVASYGPGLPEPVVEDVRQEPRTIYGISKVFSELMGFYYWRRYGVDFRAVRLPSVVGPGRGAGGASAYSTLIVQKAALGQPYEIDVDEDAKIPILYCKDAVNALLLLRNAREPKSRIYNIAGISPTALEIVSEVKKRIPGARIGFAPKPDIVAIVDSWPATLDDSKARDELGWQLSYSLDRLVTDFIEEARAAKTLYTQ
jgi:threonine 3-dehydrogenase